MNQKILLEILKTEPFSFTLREIEEIMDEELNKAPEDMDTELVDICIDILDRECSKENAASESENQKIKKLKTRKVLLIAAILIVVLGLSVSACAKFINIDASEKIVQFVNNHFVVNLGNTDTDSDNYNGNSLELINDLKEYGFEDVVLPAALISEDYSIKINSLNGENIEQVSVTFASSSTNINGTVDITKYIKNKDNFAVGRISMSDSYDQVKQIVADGMDILVFNDATNCIIYYINGNIDYYITLNCDFDSAVEIAETIK